MSQISVKEAAAMLGVSARMIYALAAPAGPIPCYRIAGRIVFDSADVEAYRESCRYLPRPKPTPLPPTTVQLKVSDPQESGLERAFRKFGIKPQRTPSSGKRKPKR